MGSGLLDQSGIMKRLVSEESTANPSSPLASGTCLEARSHGASQAAEPLRLLSIRIMSPSSPHEVTNAVTVATVVC